MPLIPPDVKNPHLSDPYPPAAVPSGRTHDRVTLWSLPIVAGITLGLTHRADLAFWLSGGFLFSGLMFGPDLDLHSRQSLRWGKLRWLWYPYRKAISHRSVWSHGPLIGTIGRIIYLALWLALLGLFSLGIYQLVWGQAYTGKQLIALLQKSIVRDYSVYISLFCGLELGAMSHYLADLLSSKYKRWQKSKRNTQKAPSDRRKK